MKCPEDADPLEVKNRCNSKITGETEMTVPFICSRKTGHDGLHHDHSIIGMCRKTWTHQEAVIEAL